MASFFGHSETIRNLFIFNPKISMGFKKKSYMFYLAIVFVDCDFGGEK
jgi:hypothetical protein